LVFPSFSRIICQLSLQELELDFLVLAVGPLSNNSGGQLQVFAEPITITVNAVPLTFTKQSTKDTSSVWSTSDGLWTLTISHQVIRKNNQDYVRTVSRLDQKKIVADPLTAVNDYQTFSSYTVEERPTFGFSSTEIKNQVSGYSTWVNLSATQDKLLNKES
jgi:hypothetical protein